MLAFTLIILLAFLAGGADAQGLRVPRLRTHQPNLLARTPYPSSRLSPQKSLPDASGNTKGAEERAEDARAWIENWKYANSPMGKTKAVLRKTITGDAKTRVRDWLWYALLPGEPAVETTKADSKADVKPRIPVPPLDDLEFVASGLREKRVFWSKLNLYDVDLFLEKGSDLWSGASSSEDIIERAPGNAALVYHFLTDQLTKKRFKKLLHESLEPQSVDATALHAFEDILMMPDRLKRGKAMVVYLDPDGVRLEYDGKELGDVKAVDLTKAILRVYFGDEAIIPDLKEKTLEKLAAKDQATASVSTAATARNFVSVSIVSLIGLFMGSGVALAVARRRLSAPGAQQPLLVG